MAQVIKTYRYRIYPTKRQEKILSDQLATCCELYNAALQERRDAWKLNRHSISYFDQSAQLKEIRAVREDVAAVSSLVLENVLKRVQMTFDGFFRRVKSHQKAGYPRFKPSARYDSITFRQIGNALTGGKVRLSRIGQIKIRLHRPLTGKVKTLTIKRETGRWFALFAVDVEPAPLPFNANIVGVDMGLRSLFTLSNGEQIENPRWLRSSQTKLRRLNRSVARKKKGSRRRQRAAMVLRRFFTHVRDQRKDFLHKHSRRIVNGNGLIAVENLNVKGLARSWLSKSITDAAWSIFISQLTYKAESAGRVFVKVDPRGTSQLCLCGAEVRKTLNERVHSCSVCGLTGDRDHISAQIILQRAVSLSGVNVDVLMSCVV